MYTEEKHLVYIIPIMLLLFVIPIIVKSQNLNLKNNLTFPKLLLVLNRTIKYQFAIGLIITIITFILDKIFYGKINSYGNIFTDLFIETTYFYIVIGIFIYLPFVGILNLINIVKHKLTNKNN